MDETWYNWNGTNITESKLQDLAEINNMSLEDYISENGIQRADDAGYTKFHPYLPY